MLTRRTFLQLVWLLGLSGALSVIRQAKAFGFIEYSRIRLLDRTKFAIVYWDTGETPLGPWPAMPQNVPATGLWYPIPLNQVALANSLDPLPVIGHALLRVWLMTGTPTNANDIPDLSTAFRAAGDATVYGAACQARSKQERQSHTIIVPLDELNRFEYCVARNSCAGCTYGVNIEWLGYWPIDG